MAEILELDPEFANWADILRQNFILDTQINVLPHGRLSNPQTYYAKVTWDPIIQHIDEHLSIKDICAGINSSNLTINDYLKNLGIHISTQITKDASKQGIISKGYFHLSAETKDILLISERQITKDGLTSIRVTATLFHQPDKGDNQ